MESYYAMQNRSIIQKRPLIAMSHRSHALNSRSAYFPEGNRTHWAENNGLMTSQCFLPKPAALGYDETSVS